MKVIFFSALPYQFVHSSTVSLSYFSIIKYLHLSLPLENQLKLILFYSMLRRSYNNKITALSKYVVDYSHAGAL